MRNTDTSISIAHQHDSCEKWRGWTRKEWRSSNCFAVMLRTGSDDRSTGNICLLEVNDFISLYSSLNGYQNISRHDCSTA
jgi:hypothetical protein